MNAPTNNCLLALQLVELSNLEAQIPLRGRQKIARNWRDVQPLLNRPVYASFNTSDTSAYTRLDSSLKQREHLRSSARRLKASEPFSRAFVEYWRQVNKLRGSVRKAFKAIDNARKELWRKLRKASSSAPTRASATTEQPPKAAE